MAKPIWAALFAALAVTSAVNAADWADDKNASGPDVVASKAQCARVRNVQPPPADRPTPAQVQALKGCNSEALYYGEKGPSDYAKARQCAFVEVQGAGGGDGPFSGDAILMMLYANGQGVAKNPDLAIHYACQLDGATAESVGRVQHLAALKAKPTAAPFDYCDDITSGLAQGYCTNIQAILADRKRDMALDGLAARTAPAARTALATLRRAADAFAKAHSDNEVDQTGTGRAAFMIEAEQATRDALAKSLGQVIGGTVPAATPAQAKAADARLNAAWNALKAHGPKVQQLGTVTFDGALKAQRAWLAYRDSFVAFARAQAPQRPTDGLFVLLTDVRTADLKDLPG